METKEPNTYIYVFKCQVQECRLEFAVFSWHKDWREKFNPFCPECGKQEAAFLRIATSEKPVCVIVYSDKLGNE